MKGKGKKGVTLQHTIITLVLLLAAAAVIFLIFFRIPYGELISEETCRSSVILRGSILGTAGEFVPGASPPPLRCKTKQLEVKTTDENEIKRIIANEMYSCWDMLGGGRINFLRKSSTELYLEDTFAVVTVKSECLICTVITFDDRLKSNPKSLDIPDYMENNKPPLRNITYLEFFADEEGARLPTEVKTEPIKTDKDYAVLFFEFESPDLWDPVLNDLGVAAAGLTGSFYLAGPRGAGSLLKSLNPVGPKVEKKIVSWKTFTETRFGAKTTVRKKIVSTKYVRGLSKAGRFIWPAVLLFMAYQTTVAAFDQHIAAGYCDGEKSGCSQVMLIPYDKETINALCNTMQSIP